MGMPAAAADDATGASGRRRSDAPPREAEYPQVDGGRGGASDYCSSRDGDGELEEDLPSHSVAMRAALRHCIDAAKRLGIVVLPEPAAIEATSDRGEADREEATVHRITPPAAVAVGRTLSGERMRLIADDARAAARAVEADREDALRRFWDDGSWRIQGRGRVAAAVVSTDGGAQSADAEVGRCKADRPVDVVRIVSGDGTSMEEGGGSVAGEGDRPAEARHQGDFAKEDRKMVRELTPLEFKRQYVHRNIPCIIRGLDRLDFRKVSSLWRRQRPSTCGAEAYQTYQDSVGGNITPERGDVFEGWFREHVGDGTMVPIRVSPQLVGYGKEGNQGDGLDDEGRAVECETVDMTMLQWIRQLRHGTNPTMYLKDWHLMKFLEDKAGTNLQTTWVDDGPLYSVPSIFMSDLLNHFLLRFTGGDYRFVYWGPALSRTDLHSDVMHSFSWSHNVSGEKKWMFYPPRPSQSPCLDQKSTASDQTFSMAKGSNQSLDIENSSSTPPSFVLTQLTGETIFVPSCWRHEVVNSRETLSINHNWVTAATVDHVLECLLIEMGDVERELEAWGATGNCTSQESMLRGCVGLDVTSFFFMVLTSLVDLLLLLFDEEDGIGKDNSTKKCSDDELWECLFSLFRLQDMMRMIIGSGAKTPKELHHKSLALDTINLEGRIGAVLMSEGLMKQAMNLAIVLSEINHTP